MSASGPPVSVDARSAVITPPQLLAMRVLVVSGSIVDAASAAGVHERTVRRWLQTPEFSAGYRAAARDAASEAMSALLAAQREAVAALVTSLQSPVPAIRVRAARALLDLGRHAADDDLDHRLRELESEVARWLDGTTDSTFVGD